MLVKVTLCHDNLHPLCGTEWSKKTFTGTILAGKGPEKSIYPRGFFKTQKEFSAQIGHTPSLPHHQEPYFAKSPSLQGDGQLHFSLASTPLVLHVLCFCE